MVVKNPFGEPYCDLMLPDTTRVVRMKEPPRITHPQSAIKEQLAHPIASDSLQVIAQKKMHECQRDKNRQATAVIVVSDNTRPVPYKGEEGILLPIIEILLRENYRIEDLCILIATGTHSPMSEQEIARMIDERVLCMGIGVYNHDCTDATKLTYIGRTQKGTEIEINSHYMQADLKIATGLVESHFMAGASGGRKAICPGLIGEKSTFVFHGAPFMAHKDSRDLNLKGNLVHEEAIEVATIAGIDFLVNVTLDHAFHITGVFAGNFIAAHEQAVSHISECVKVPAKSADIVITHAGFVGINHYQCAKCAVASLGILKQDGYLIIIADATDTKHVVGGVNYRTTLALLQLIGAENFLKMITSDDWTFIPEQWQVQMWTKVFQRIPMDHLILYAPQLDALWWPGIPGIDGSRFLEGIAKDDPRAFEQVITNGLSYIAQREHTELSSMDITWIEDGPYVVPESNSQ